MFGLNRLSPLGLVKICTTNLRVNWLRSALTVLGMVFGTGAVIATMSSNEGAKVFVQKELAKLGTNVLTFQLGAGAHFRNEDADALLRYSDAFRSAQVALEVSQITISHRARSAQPGATIGVGPGFYEAMRLDLAAGRIPNALERQEARAVVVLGAKLAKDLFGDRSPIGERIELNAEGARYVARVAGVLAEKGINSGINFDTMIYLSERLARQLAAKTPRSFLVATLVSDQDTVRAKAEAEAVLRSRFDAQTLKIFDAREAIERTQAIWQKQNLVGMALAAVCLLTGGVGIMNVMTLSVLQRKREVGLRKAIGATDLAITWQFLLEAILVCLIGGLAGVVVGWGFGNQVAKLLGNWEATMSPAAVTVALAFATGVGVFFGLYPAIRASRLAPYDALRG